MFHKRLVTIGILMNTLLWPVARLPAELLVGTAVTDITPCESVAVSGQFHLRIANTVQTPITANVIALESRAAGLPRDQAIMISCDLLCIPTEVLERVRSAVRRRLPNLKTAKLFLHGTHTHTAPVLLLDKYPIPKEGAMQVEQYRSSLTQRIADAIVRAWNERSPGSVTWGLSHAVVAYNRRAVYADGSARMYGKTDIADFRNLEGYEDHDINTLFFWNDSDALTAVIVNVSCPAQEVESRSAVNAIQTFLVQLVGPGTYLPTEKAIRGGHYSAVVHSSLVGPEGGNILVDRTVDLIDSLWTESSGAP